MSAAALRMRYEIVGKVRFVSSRDLSRIWERTLRRVNVPVAYSQGFTPRPRLSFGLALPTCAASSAEYVDARLVESSEDRDESVAQSLGAAVDAALPDGLAVHAAAYVDASGSSLQEAVTSVTWELSGFEQSSGQLSACADEALAADELPLERERKGAVTIDDIRPLIIDLAVDATPRDRSASSAPRVTADIASVGRSLRPAELARAVFGVDDAASVHIHRVAQWTDGPHGRSELLPPPEHARSMSPC